MRAEGISRRAPKEDLTSGETATRACQRGGQLADTSLLVIAPHTQQREVEPGDHSNDEQNRDYGEEAEDGRESMENGALILIPGMSRCKLTPSRPEAA